MTCILSSANKRSYSMDSIHSGYTLTHTDNRRHWNTYTFLNKVPVHTHVDDVHYGEELALCPGKVLESKCYLWDKDGGEGQKRKVGRLVSVQNYVYTYVMFTIPVFQMAYFCWHTWVVVSQFMHYHFARTRSDQCHFCSCLFFDCNFFFTGTLQTDGNRWDILTDKPKAHHNVTAWIKIAAVS